MKRITDMKVSIIIPGFDPDIKLLSKAIISVVEQKNADIELIYVDDGSKETNRLEIVSMLKEINTSENVELKWFLLEHGGVSRARNYGIHEACGEAVMFLDADDFLLPGVISEAVSIYEDRKADAVLGAVTRNEQYECSIDPMVSEYDNDGIRQILSSLLSVDKTLKFSNCYIGRGPYAKLVKASIAKEVLFDESLAFREDVLWNLQLLLKCNKIAIVNKAWYYYYLNPNSVMQSYKPDIADILERAAEKIETVLKENGINIENDFLDYLYQELIMIYRLYLGQEENRELKKKLEEKLYTTQPWIRIKSRQTDNSIGAGRRIMLALYKRRLLFDVLDIEKIVLGRV